LIEAAFGGVMGEKCSGNLKKGDKRQNGKD
jgi:hypothetical protein